MTTISIAFELKPMQAAALLTNNNQYLVTSCVKGVKGGNFEPLIAWYSMLIEQSENIADLIS